MKTEYTEDGLDEEDDSSKDNEDEFSIDIEIELVPIMANLDNLLIGMFFGTLAQISTFYQLQGSPKFEVLERITG
jgi:hypothetical protein